MTIYICILKKEMATHSSILAWRIPRTEEPGRVARVGHDLAATPPPPYTHVPSLLSLSPLPPAYPSRSSQSSRLGSPCYIATFHYLSYT